VTNLNAVPFIYVQDRDDAGQHRAVIDQLLTIAATVGCGLILNAGLRGAGDDQGRFAAADLLRHGFRRGRDLGVPVSIEAPHAGMTAVTVREAVHLLELVGEPELGVTYDASHVVVGGDTIAESLELIGDRIAGVQARDGRGQDFHLTPGDGDVDWDALLGHLLARGFDRPVVLELEYGGALGPAEIRVEAERARSFLQGRIELLVSRVS
jgi:sugar phosphate isomerase/epimerase